MSESDEEKFEVPENSKSCISSNMDYQEPL
jgi:hypothetical protein